MKPLVLFNSSIGGHLTEVDFLRRAMGDAVRAVLVVNAEGSVPREGYESVHRVRHAVRSPAVVVNMVEAWRLLRRFRPALIVSCGAGVAVAFGVVGRVLRIPVVHVESFSAVRQPTLTGRIMARVASAFFVQWEGMRAVFPRARYEGAVVEVRNRAPGAGETRERAPGPPRVFASVGNAPQRFDRFVAEVAQLAALRPDAEIVLQGGTSLPPQAPLPANVRAVTLLGFEEFGREIARADMVLCHAGAGAILRSLEAGRIPWVLPRLADYGEHVDNHQRQLADEFTRLGFVHLYPGAAGAWANGDSQRGTPLTLVEPNRALAGVMLDCIDSRGAR